MKGAIVAAIVFAIFIALVEWRRHNTARALPKRFDTKVAQVASRRSTRSAKAAGGPGALVTRQGGGEEDPTPAPAPADADAAAPPPIDAEEAARQRKKAAAVMDAIRRLLASEPRDEAWASDIEAWVASRGRAFPGTRVERVACKATLCAVDAVHDGNDAYAAWVSRFPAQEKNLRMVTLPSALPGGRTRTESFLAQEGRALPEKSP